MSVEFETPVTTSFKKNSKSWGFWQTLPHPAISRTILRAHPPAAPPYSWVCIDAEHGLIHDVHYYDLCNAVAAEGVSPIIRVPDGQESLIKRALDAGAHGVMVPMCRDATHAASIVKYTRYPPQGTRGFGPMFATHALAGVDVVPTYMRGAARSLVTVVQIETREGVENVEAIAGTEGVDVLLVGPWDLSTSLGVHFDSEEFKAAVARILNASHEAGKKAAIFCSNGAQAKGYADQGFDMISITMDVNVLAAGHAKEFTTANGN